MASLCYVVSQLIEVFKKNKNAVSNCEPREEKINKKAIICVRMGKKKLSLAISICHHSASLVMPNGDPWNRFSVTSSHS